MVSLKIVRASFASIAAQYLRRHLLASDQENKHPKYSMNCSLVFRKAQVYPSMKFHLRLRMLSLKIVRASFASIAAQYLKRHLLASDQDNKHPKYSINCSLSSSLLPLHSRANLHPARGNLCTPPLPFERPMIHRKCLPEAVLWPVGPNT
ncbi:hypothetical protein BC332_34130 [Capsicum chinense]|nr:hypothetical protein BC332_34130 [Capsicum chinense]